MSDQLFNKVLAFTLHWEGGKVDDPDDIGGRTNFGITQRTYNVYRKNHNLPPKDVFNITPVEVRTIYQTQFWQPTYSYLNQFPLAVAMFDTAVQFNPPTFTRFVSDALNVNQPNKAITAFLNMVGRPMFVNGTMLEKMKALDVHEQLDAALRIVDLRKQYRQERVNKNPSQAKFLKGWLRRDNDLENHIRGIK